MKNALIIGGGITGLAAAYRLQILAPDISIILIEQDNRLGGKLLTEQVNGFLIEAGPDSFLSRKPRGVGLCEELGLTNLFQARDPRHNKTFVRRHGALHPLPSGLTGMIPTNLDALNNSTLISPEGKARLAQEPDLPPAPGNDDESVAQFVSRRLGREVYENVVEPLMSGIYAGDGEQLSLLATFPQLRQLERKYGSLIKGLLANQAASGAASANYPPFISLRPGISELVTQLLARLTNTKIVTGVGVKALTQTAGRGYTATLSDGQRINADALIITTPAFVTARLVETIDPTLAEAHAAIPYVSSATVCLAFAPSDLPAPLVGYGYVVPRAEDTDVLAATWTSNKWEGRAPDDQVLVRIYLGRYGRRDVSLEDDTTLLDMAYTELRETAGITAKGYLSHIYRWPLGMPQYKVGHLQRLAAIEERLAQHSNLLVAGAAYRGVGIPDCILAGEQAAQGVANYLSQRDE
ncbi:MAG: protoporphyrinogen oxidase [Caldilineaceae bacterium]